MASRCCSGVVTGGPGGCGARAAGSEGRGGHHVRWTLVEFEVARQECGRRRGTNARLEGIDRVLTYIHRDSPR